MEHLYRQLEAKIKESGDYVVITRTSLLALLVEAKGVRPEQGLDTLDPFDPRFVDMVISAISQYSITAAEVKAEAGIPLSNFYNFKNRKKEFARRFRSKLRDAIVSIMAKRTIVR